MALFRLQNNVLPWLRGNLVPLALLAVVPAALILLWLAFRPPLFESTLTLAVDGSIVHEGNESRPMHEPERLARLLGSEEMLYRIAADLDAVSPGSVQQGLRIHSLNDAGVVEVVSVSADAGVAQGVLDSMMRLHPPFLEQFHLQQIRHETASVLRKLDELLADEGRLEARVPEQNAPFGHDNLLYLPANSVLTMTDAAVRLEAALLEGLVDEYRRVVASTFRVQVLDAPTEPVNLRAGISTGLPLGGALLSLLLGAPLLYLRYRWRDRISFAAEWPEDACLPMLGSLPRVSPVSGSENLLSRISDTDFHESLRGIRTRLQLQNGGAQGRDGSLLLHGLERRGRSLLLLSSEPGAGRSTMAQGLALMLGQVERVLLINADMRPGTEQQDYCGIPGGAPGLSHLIAGAAPVRRCLHRLEDGGIDVLPAGVAPPNPQELLASRRFARIMQALKRRYDFVIVDGPAMQEGDDSLLLAEHCEQLLYVLRADISSLNDCHRAVARLQTIKTDMDGRGILLNAVDRKKMRRFGLGEQRLTLAQYMYRSPRGHYLADY